MVPENKHLYRYLYEAAIAEFADKYLREGYRVEKEGRVGSIHIDLIVEKPGHKVYFEFKVRKSDKRHEELLQVKKQAEADGAQFRLVYVSPPSHVAVRIEDIEKSIFTYLVNNVPPEIQRLSPYTSIKSISDVNLDSVDVQPHKIMVKGYFSLAVDFVHEPSIDIRQDDGYTAEDAFVTTFEAEFDSELNLITLASSVDTSSWDE